MKLKNLIEYDFVTDKTAFRISSVRSNRFQRIKNGNWYDDRVLNFLNFNVRKFTYYNDLDLLEVSLVFPEDEENKQESKTPKPPKQGPTKEVWMEAKKI